MVSQVEIRDASYLTPVSLVWTNICFVKCRNKRPILLNTITLEIRSMLLVPQHLGAFHLYLRHTLNPIRYSRYCLELTTLLHGPTNVECCFSIFQAKLHLLFLHMNQGTTSSKERPPKNNRDLKDHLSFKNHKIGRKYKRLHFHEYIMEYPNGPLHCSSDHQ